jgi:hypothetical protein
MIVPSTSHCRRPLGKYPATDSGVFLYSRSETWSAVSSGFRPPALASHTFVIRLSQSVSVPRRLLSDSSREASRGYTKTSWQHWKMPLKAIAAKIIDSLRRMTKGTGAKSAANMSWSARQPLRVKLLD